jgi:hypothetical protein
MEAWTLNYVITPLEVLLMVIGPAHLFVLHTYVNLRVHYFSPGARI